jgi:type II secretory pathway component PulK
MNARGVALPMVLIAVAILAILAVELHYTVSIDQRLGNNQADGLRAYYLAKSAMRFAMWRVNFYMAATTANSSSGGTATSTNTTNNTSTNNSASPAVPQQYIDMLWNFEIPAMPFDTTKLQVSAIEKSDVEEAKAKSTVVPHDKFRASIQGEGSKIGLSLLTGDEAWNSTKEIRDSYKALLMQLMQQEYLDDEKFQDRFPDFEPERYIDALIDYMDVDNVRIKDQGNEDDEYSHFDPPYKPKNMPVYSLEELHMVSGWEGEIFERFSKHFTAYLGHHYLNVNTVGEQVLKALAPNVDVKSLREFLAKRSIEPFKKTEDFVTKFKELPGVDAKFNSDGALRFSVNERTFVISATGQSNDVLSKQVAAVRLESLPVDNKDCSQEANKEECEKKKAELPPLNHLRLVYWREVPL